VEHLKGVSLGLVPALLAKIKLSWKGLPEKTLQLIGKLQRKDNLSLL
jgi:hypothetical protein